MAAEASVNAVYANKIAAIADEDERAAFVAERTRRAAGRHQPAAHGAASSSSTPSSSPATCAPSSIARLADADRWSRATGRRHHLISPV